MTLSDSRLPRWLTYLVGGTVALFAALWLVRRRPAPLPLPVSKTGALVAVSPADVALNVPTPTYIRDFEHSLPARPLARWRVVTGWLLALASCLLLGTAAVLFPGSTPYDAPMLLLVGAAGLTAALFLYPPTSAKWTSTPRIRERFRWWQAGVGLLCIIVLTLWNLAGHTIISGHAQLLLLCVGIALVVYGFGGPLLPLERSTWQLVGLITVIALLLRVVALDSAIRFFIDEANFADGTRIALFSNPPLLARFSSITAFPWIYPYIESMAVDVFGRNLFGLRVVSAVFGTLTIPAVYMLARALFNKPVALAAALLLATFPPHVHFSRIGINNIADPLFGTLALAGLAWGWRTGRRGYFALAGGALGLTQYFYDGGRLLYPPLLLAWVAACAVCLLLRRDDRHGRVSGVLIMLLVAFIIGAPIYLVSAAQNEPFSQRYNQEGAALSLFSVSDILQRMWETFLLYIQRAEGSFFYLGAAPFLQVYAAGFFLIGLVYAGWRALRLDYGGFLLLFWVIITSAGNALLTTPFVSARYVVVFPALALITGLGLYVTLQLVLRRERWLRRLLALAVVVMALAQVYYYFAIHVPLYNDQSRLYEDSQDAVFRSANFPPGTQIHIIADPVAYHDYARSVLWFLRDDLAIDVISPLDFTPDYLEHLPHGTDHAFFMVPQDAASRDLLGRYFTVGVGQHSPYPLPPHRELLLYYASRFDNP
ncbi:MAG: glycosyltransferase family 39 protein [Anaerolineae bacterium]